MHSNCFPGAFPSSQGDLNKMITQIIQIFTPVSISLGTMMNDSKEQKKTMSQDGPCCAVLIMLLFSVFSDALTS